MDLKKTWAGGVFSGPMRVTDSLPDSMIAFLLQHLLQLTIALVALFLRAVLFAPTSACHQHLLQRSLPLLLPLPQNLGILITVVTGHHAQVTAVAVALTVFAGTKVNSAFVNS